MSSFDGKNLFSTGPHRFEVRGVELRHSTHEAPGSLGVRVGPQGVSGRTIFQTGHLIADDATALRELTSAIEAMLDGLAHELIDDLGRSWPQTVMLAFRLKTVERLGPRVRVPYRIEYLQLTP
ncbi:MAG: hypothetical protein K8S99_06530 [Planctomycetes bacterium]|nr:hypothetical protein [Planctomycetota bacterium]